MGKNPSLAALLWRVFVSYMEKYSHTLRAIRISDSQETMQEPSNLFARDNHVIFKKKNPQVSLWFQTLQFIKYRVILHFFYEGGLSYVEQFFCFAICNSSVLVLSDLVSFQFVCPNLQCKFLLQRLPCDLCFCSKLQFDRVLIGILGAYHEE